MNCLDAEKHFSAYLEDELDYHMIRGLETHLEHCDSCQYGFEGFRKSLDVLHHLPHLEPSFDFNNEVQICIDDLELGRDRPWHPIVDAVRSQAVWVFTGIGTLMALIIILMGVFVYQNGTKSVRSPRASGVLNAHPSDGLLRERGLDRMTRIARPVPPVILPFPIGEFGFDKAEESETNNEHRRTEQNYILQTIDYSAPSGGGL